MPLFSGTGVSAVSTVTATAPITSTGGNAPVISLNNTAVVAGSYTSPTITVDAQGRLTSAVNGSAQAAADASSIRAAASDYAAVAFDGTTSGTRIVSTLTGQNIGTGDMSMWNRFRVPTATGGNRYIASLSSSSTSADQSRSIIVYIPTAGGLAVIFYGATTSDFRFALINGFQSAYSGQVVDVVVTRTGATFKIYVNGTDTAYTESTGGTPPAWSDTITSTNLLVGGTSTTSIFSGRIYRSVVFNRALSQSDVTELISTGVNPADQWGTQTAIYTSDFSTASTDGFTGIACTVASNIDSIGGQDNNLRTTIDGTTGFHLFARASTLPRAKTVRVVADFYRPASNTVVTGVNAQHYNQVATATTTQLVADTWTTITQDVRDLAASGSNSAVAWYLATVTGSITVVGNSTDVVYVRNIQVTRIGAIVDLDFTVGTGYQTYDRSTNNLHGTMFGGVEFMMPRRSAVLYAMTSTSGNQQMLGTLAIPTNAIIEDIIVNSTGSCTVSVGNASAGTQIVNAAAVVSGRQKLTLATPFSSTGNLWVNSSTAATLQFTISYTIAL